MAPPGYLPLGHVPSIGLDPPADPVWVYRNDSEKGIRPSVKPAREFHLIWRQNGRSPVTMWEPLPPQGYRALGTVVVPDAEQPGSKEVLCLREDLCSKTGIFDSPIWKFEPPIMQVILLNFCCLSAVSGKSQRHVRQVDCQVLSVRQCITSRDCTAHTSLLCLLEHDSDVASLMLQLAGKQAQRVHVLLGWLECATAEDVLSRDMALQLLASGQSSRHLPSQSLLDSRSLAKMILAGTFMMPFCSQATVRQVRLQLTSLDRRTHSYSSLGSRRAAFILFAALPAATSP